MSLLRPWLLLALSGALVAAFALGWRTGAQITQGRQAVALAAARATAIRNADALSVKESQRLALETERDALARTLEDAAHADPDAGRPALGLDSVRRIARR